MWLWRLRSHMTCSWQARDKELMGKSQSMSESEDRETLIFQLKVSHVEEQILLYPTFLFYSSLQWVEVNPHWEHNLLYLVYQSYPKIPSQIYPGKYLIKYLGIP